MTVPTPAPAPPAARLDWQRVERWAGEIAAGEIAGVRAVFAAEEARGPEIRWRPPVESLVAPQHRFLLRYWSDLAGTRPMPPAREVDAMEMRPALGYVNLLDVVDSGRDFRYRVFGSIVAAVSGFDMTGQMASELRASAYVVEFGLAVFRAALRRGEPLFTEHGPPATVYTSTWHRLVLPLANAEGAIARLLVGAVPIAHDGRPVTFRL